MPGIIFEDNVSRGFVLAKTGTEELRFTVLHTEDRAEIETLINGYVPPTWNGREIERIGVEKLEGLVWRVTASYVRLENFDEYTFDTGGGTQKITQSLFTVNSYAPPGLTPPDFKGAIGVSEDKVEGCDVPTPNFTFSETHRFADIFVDTSYKQTLFNMTGRMNDGDFKGLAAGECQFLGAAGTKRGDELWSITFRFTGRPNRSGVTIGDIEGIDALGNDYLWVRYQDYADTSAHALVKRPSAVYVERVLLTGDFSLLGIGI